MTDLDLPAARAQFLAVDFESTGAVPGYPDQPWQLAIVPVADGRVMAGEAYETLLHVDAARPFSPFAPGSWSVRREALARAPTLAALASTLARNMDGMVLVAHNAPTEKKFFREAWPLHRTGHWIDTLKLSRVAFPGLASYELQSVLEVAGLSSQLQALIPGRAAHDALYDAAASALILCHLVNEAGWGRHSVAGLIAASGGKPG